MNKEVEVMRVLRVPPMGKLVVEFKGERYENISEVDAENVSRLLLTAVGELVTFAGGYQNLVDEGLAPELEVPTASSAADSEEAPESLTEKQARFISTLEASRDAVKVEKKKASTALPGIQRVNTTPSNALSPVEQIDAILQSYIEADPELSNHKIHLVQHPAGGLQINVDSQSYQHPREIEDEKIQMVIKKAIKEWEAG